MVGINKSEAKMSLYDDVGERKYEEKKQDEEKHSSGTIIHGPHIVRWMGIALRCSRPPAGRRPGHYPLPTDCQREATAVFVCQCVSGRRRVLVSVGNALPPTTISAT